MGEGERDRRKNRSIWTSPLQFTSIRRAVVLLLATCTNFEIVWRLSPIFLKCHFSISQFATPTHVIKV